MASKRAPSISFQGNGRGIPGIYVGHHTGVVLVAGLRSGRASDVVDSRKAYKRNGLYRRGSSTRDTILPITPHRKEEEHRQKHNFLHNKINWLIIKLV